MLGAVGLCSQQVWRVPRSIQHLDVCQPATLRRLSSRASIHTMYRQCDAFDYGLCPNSLHRRSRVTHMGDILESIIILTYLARRNFCFVTCVTLRPQQVHSSFWYVSRSQTFYFRVSFYNSGNVTSPPYCYSLPRTEFL